MFRIAAVALCAETDDDEDQCQRGDYLAEEVHPVVPDGRSRAERPELRSVVVGGIVVVFVENPHEDTAQYAADHLCGDVDRDRTPGEHTRYSQAE